MSEKIEFDFFGDGMRIFLDYINRQFKKNPNYLPHPLIRAFACAIQAIDKTKVGEHSMGISQDGTKDEVYNPFIVVLKKKDNGIEVKEIRNVKVNKTVPIDVMLTIFRLQIVLDRIDGDTVTPQQMVETLNAVIPGNKFYALGDKWREARDEFKKQLKAGKIHIPNDPELIEGLRNITYDTPWEDYPIKVRAFIGSLVVRTHNLPFGTVVITSPEDSKIEKYKVFDTVMEFLLGEGSKYLNIRRGKIEEDK